MSKDDDERLHNLIVSGVYADNEEMGQVAGFVIPVVVVIGILYYFFG